VVLSVPARRLAAATSLEAFAADISESTRKTAARADSIAAAARAVSVSHTLICSTIPIAGQTRTAGAGMVSLET